MSFSASSGTESGSDEPFKTFIEEGKRYRDAIHHTTPFQRKDVESGGRLTALYEINANIALHCIVLSSATLLKISQWTYGTSDETDISSRCSELLEKAHRAWLANQAQEGHPVGTTEIAVDPIKAPTAALTEPAGHATPTGCRNGYPPTQTPELLRNVELRKYHPPR